MEKNKLETKLQEAIPKKTAEEIEYLSSIMSETRQEGYTCVTGCSECVSCDGNSVYNIPLPPQK